MNTKTKLRRLCIQGACLLLPLVAAGLSLNWVVETCGIRCPYNLTAQFIAGELFLGGGALGKVIILLMSLYFFRLSSRTATTSTNLVACFLIGMFLSLSLIKLLGPSDCVGVDIDIPPKCIYEDVIED